MYTPVGETMEDDRFKGENVMCIVFVCIQDKTPYSWSAIKYVLFKRVHKISLYINIMLYIVFIYI